MKSIHLFALGTAATLSDGTVILAMCEGQDTALANIKAALG